MENKRELDVILPYKEYKELREKADILDNLDNKETVSRIAVFPESSTPVRHEIVIYNKDNTVEMLKKQIEDYRVENSFLRANISLILGLFRRMFGNKKVSKLLRKYDMFEELYNCSMSLIKFESK